MYFALNVCDGSPNGENNEFCSHMFRPTITDMQDNILVTVTILTLLEANTKETTKEVARPSPQNTFCGESPPRVNAKYGDTVTALLIMKLGVKK